MLLLLALAFLGHLTIWIGRPLQAGILFTATALLAMTVSTPALVFLWFLDRRERESVWLFGGALVWGMAISTGVSAVFNALGSGVIALGLEMGAVVDSDSLVADLLTAALVAPPVEEAAKGLGILILFWFLRSEFDNLRDGLIYGALVGLGFNIAETALYVMAGFLETGEAPIAHQFATRFVFLGLNGHFLWTALCGAGLGIARQTARAWLRFAAPAGGFLLAVFAHAMNNSVGIFAVALLLVLMGHDPTGLIDVSPPQLWLAASLMNVLVQGFPYLVFLALLVVSARQERAVIRTYLADEVDGRIVLPAEFQSIMERMPLLGMHRAAFVGGRRTLRIANAQTELAFRKWHLAREGGDPEADPLVAAWRADILHLRNS